MTPGTEQSCISGLMSPFRSASRHRQLLIIFIAALFVCCRLGFGFLPEPTAIDQSLLDRWKSSNTLQVRCNRRADYVDLLIFVNESHTEDYRISCIYRDKADLKEVLMVSMNVGSAPSAWVIKQWPEFSFTSSARWRYAQLAIELSHLDEVHLQIVQFDSARDAPIANYSTTARRLWNLCEARSNTIAPPKTSR